MATSKRRAPVNVEFELPHPEQRGATLKESVRLPQAPHSLVFFYGSKSIPGKDEFLKTGMGIAMPKLPHPQHAAAILTAAQEHLTASHAQGFQRQANLAGFAVGFAKGAADAVRLACQDEKRRPRAIALVNPTLSETDIDALEKTLQANEIHTMLVGPESEIKGIADRLKLTQPKVRRFYTDQPNGVSGNAADKAMMENAARQIAQHFASEPTSSSQWNRRHRFGLNLTEDERDRLRVESALSGLYYTKKEQGEEITRKRRPHK